MDGFACESATRPDTTAAGLNTFGTAATKVTLKHTCKVQRQQAPITSCVGDSSVGRGWVSFGLGAASAAVGAGAEGIAYPPKRRCRGCGAGEPPGNRGDDVPGGGLPDASAAALLTMVAIPERPRCRGVLPVAMAEAKRAPAGSKTTQGRKVTEVSAAAHVGDAVSTAIADDSSISSMPTEISARPAYDATVSRFNVPSAARCALLIAAMSVTMDWWTSLAISGV